jgi:hypothetical protein
MEQSARAILEEAKKGGLTDVIATVGMDVGTLDKKASQVLSIATPSLSLVTPASYLHW